MIYTALYVVDQSCLPWFPSAVSFHYVMSVGAPRSSVLGWRLATLDWACQSIIIIIIIIKQENNEWRIVKD